MAAEAAAGVERDIAHLIEGINRLGSLQPEDSSKAVTFSALFKDEELEQQLESLVGSLKAAKKRGLLAFEGQMLLQGVSDSVVITLGAAHVTAQ
jgi:hypothetical protein